MAITVAPDRRQFLEDGRPFFYLADTVWAAFYGTLPEQWPVYLAARKSQGFNTLQISILPILHDCETVFRRVPFAVKPDGSWDLDDYNEDYFAYGAARLREARAAGFKICLTLLWGNYVPGNWMSQKYPGTAMNTAQIRRYTAYIAERFAGLAEFYFISGDVDFSTPENTAGYLLALEELKKHCPDVLCSLHSAGGNRFLPPEFTAHPDLDFYVFQSGHHVDRQGEISDMARAYAAYPPRPVINAEPCYEGHGNACGRFGIRDVAYAFWESVLTGASAGFGYGAHGIWSWHDAGMTFGNEGWSKTPFLWHEALSLPGAERIKGWTEMFADARGMELIPQTEGVVSMAPGTVLACGAEVFLLFIPCASAVELPFSLSDWEIRPVDVESGRAVYLTVQELDGGRSRLSMPPINAALAVSGRRKNPA